MIFWLDHLIFGNGYGLRSPASDNVFRCLSGELYTFCPGFGAQLTSFQWTHPRAGERRRLGGYEFKAFFSERRWGRVRCIWAVVGLPKDIDAANAMLRQMDHDLGGSMGRTFKAPSTDTATSKGGTE